MKQIAKASMRQLLQATLELPIQEREHYEVLLNCKLPDRVTRGELIALTLVDRASRGDMEAIKELRQWIIDAEPKGTAGTTNYYQYLVQITPGAKGAEVAPSIAQGVKKLAENLIIEVPISDEKRAEEILEDLQ